MTTAETPAATLRAAAQRLRELAEKATQGTWRILAEPLARWLEDDANRCAVSWEAWTPGQRRGDGVWTEEIRDDHVIAHFGCALAVARAIPDCPVHGDPPVYTLESLTADLAQAKADSATNLSAAELTHLTTAATQDAASRYPGDESYAARFTQEVLADLAATPVGEVAATERWRRRQALARGDSLSAYWPEVAG